MNFRNIFRGGHSPIGVNVIHWNKRFLRIQLLEYVKEEDFHLFLIEYYVYLHGSHNVIKVLAKELTNKMK